MDPLKPRFPRMWKIVGTLLLCAIFVTKNQACHVFHLGTSDDDQSRGQAVTFVRGEMEVTVKASSQEEGKFGFYLLNQNDTVAGITLEQTNTSVFIEFLSKIKENQEDISEVNENLETISIAFVNTTLFKNDVMRRVRIHYTHGLLAVSFLVKGEEFTEDDLDFRSSKDVYGDSATKEYWITRKARVTPLFGLPLSIYPVVLAGQGHKVSLNCLRGLGNVDPSKYFLERFPKEGSSWMYFIPSRDFKLATLIFDLSEGPTSVGLDAEDVVTDRYNLLKLEYKSEKAEAEILMPSKRNCLKRIPLEGKINILDITLVANAPVKWYFDENGPTPPADLLLPECGQHIETRPTGCRNDVNCKNLCQYRNIGLYQNTSASAKVPLVDRADFMVKPGVQNASEFNFSIWLQDAGHLLAGVHVSQSNGKVELRFYQVKNVTYVLRDTQTLQSIQLQGDAWTWVYLSYTGAEMEIGLKNAEETTWQTAKSTVPLEHQLPVSAFVWSREDLYVAVRCERDDGSFTREPDSFTSSPSKEIVIPEGSTTIYFKPTKDFRVATVVLGEKDFRHIQSSNVVVGEWNRISFWIPPKVESIASLPRIGLPRPGHCRLQEETSWFSFVQFLSNIPMRWYFGLPPGQSESGSDTCAVNSVEGCSVKVIGRKVSQPVPLVDEVEFGVRTRPGNPFVATLSIVLTTALQELAKIDIIKLNRPPDYILYSKELGINVRLDYFGGFGGENEGLMSKFGLRHPSSGHLEFKIETYSPDIGDYVWQTYISNKTLELDTSIMFYTYSNDSKLVFFYGDREIEEVDPSETEPKSQRIIVDENGTTVTFRSPIKSITSLTFDLLDGTRTVGRFQLYHTDKDNVSALSYNEKVTVIVEVAVQPNRWTELLLRQMESEVQIGLRTSSGDEWVTKRVSIGVIPKQPLIAVFDSRHYHELILNCEREDGKFVAENEVTKDVPEVPTGTPMPQLVWVAKTAEISSVAVGQTSSILVFANTYIKFVLLHLRHKDGSISSINANLGRLETGKFAVIYLNNTGEEEGVSSVNVPNQVGKRSFQKVNNKGPVQSFDVYSIMDSFWFYSSCDKVPGAVMEETMSSCLVGNVEDTRESSLQMIEVEKEVPAGNSMLLLQLYSPPDLVVYFHHDSGDISVREISESSYNYYTSRFRIHNTENPEGHALVMLTLAGHFEYLEGKGTVKKVTLYMRQSYVCVIIMGMCN